MYQTSRVGVSTSFYPMLLRGRNVRNIKEASVGEISTKYSQCPSELQET